MKITGPGAFSLDGLGQWARTFAASVAQGWLVQHTIDGTHVFPWKDELYSAALFTGSGAMTWTVESSDMVSYRYCIVGSTMELVFDIWNSVVGGTPSTALTMTIPGGRAAAATRVTGTFVHNDGGTASIGSSSVSATKVYLYRSLAAPNWTAGTVRVAGVIRFEVA